MPTYEVKLAAASGDATRVTRLGADDEDQARAICEAREAEAVAFTLSEEELAECAAVMAGQLEGDPSRARARLALNEQIEPYVIQSVKEV